MNELQNFNGSTFHFLKSDLITAVGFILALLFAQTSLAQSTNKGIAPFDNRFLQKECHGGHAVKYMRIDSSYYEMIPVRSHNHNPFYSGFTHAVDLGIPIPAAEFSALVNEYGLPLTKLPAWDSGDCLLSQPVDTTTFKVRSIVKNSRVVYRHKGYSMSTDVDWGPDVGPCDREEHDPSNAEGLEDCYSRYLDMRKVLDSAAASLPKNYSIQANIAGEYSVWSPDGGANQFELRYKGVRILEVVLNFGGNYFTAYGDRTNPQTILLSNTSTIQGRLISLPMRNYTISRDLKCTTIDGENSCMPSFCAILDGESGCSGLFIPSDLQYPDPYLRTIAELFRRVIVGIDTVSQDIRSEIKLIDSIDQSAEH